MGDTVNRRRAQLVLMVVVCAMTAVGCGRRKPAMPTVGTVVECQVSVAAAAPDEQLMGQLVDMLTADLDADGKLGIIVRATSPGRIEVVIPEVDGQPIIEPTHVAKLTEALGQALAFHIVVQPDEPDLPGSVALAEPVEGPAEAPAGCIWLPLADVDKFAWDQSTREALNDDPRAFLAGMNMVGQKHEGKVYLLVWNTPDRCIANHAEHKGWRVKRVQASMDQNYVPAIAFSLNQRGADLMGDLTAKHVGRAMAIVIGNQVMSAPRIQTRLGADAQITGGREGFTPEEQKRLLMSLGIGRLSDSLSVDSVTIIRTQRVRDLD